MNRLYKSLCENTFQSGIQIPDQLNAPIMIQCTRVLQGLLLPTYGLIKYIKAY